jgi:hypothetical protein
MDKLDLTWRIIDACRKKSFFFVSSDDTGAVHKGLPLFFPHCRPPPPSPTPTSKKRPNVQIPPQKAVPYLLASLDLIDGFGSLMFIILAFNHALTGMGMAVNVGLFVSTLLKIANACWTLADNSDKHRTMLKWINWI